MLGKYNKKGGIGKLPGAWSEYWQWPPLTEVANF